MSQRKQTKPLKKIPWIEVVSECYDKGLNFIYPVIKVIYTDDKTERAVLLKRPDTSYTIAFEKLYPFDEDELRYTDGDLHGYWSPTVNSIKSTFDTEERAVKAIFADAPFKYNKSVIWADFSFRIDAESLYWIKNNGIDDPYDFCLHGQVFAKIGDEIFEYDPTVSAVGLYLLRSLSDNHIIHDGQAMLPCCGFWMLADDDLRSVYIDGCPNGIDWSVIHENDKIKLVTESGKETFIDIDDYRKEVYAFADKIEDYYKMSLPKDFSESDELSQNGYIAFWNQWHRLRNL